MNRKSLFSITIVLLLAGTLPMCSQSSDSGSILAPESFAAKSSAQPAAQTTLEEVAIKISPATLALNSSGEWVTVHADIAYTAVDTESFSMNGIAASWTKADDCGDLVVKFDQEEIKNIVSPPEAELVLSGAKLDGTLLTGSETIKVISREGR